MPSGGSIRLSAARKSRKLLTDKSVSFALPESETLSRGSTGEQSGRLTVAWSIPGPTLPVIVTGSEAHSDSADILRRDRFSRGNLRCLVFKERGGSALSNRDLPVTVQHAEGEFLRQMNQTVFLALPDERWFR
jgi:hypothetical protein